MKIFKIIILQIYWYISIKYGNNFYIPTAGLLIFCGDYFIFRKAEKLNRKYLFFSVILVITGFLMDKIFNLVGILFWGDRFYPIELVGVWLIFPTYYYHFFKKFTSPRWLPFIAGSIFGPIAYISGGNINPELTLSYGAFPNQLSLLFLSICWGIYFGGSVYLFFKSKLFGYPLN